jgi:hypothetical protein
LCYTLDTPKLREKKLFDLNDEREKQNENKMIIGDNGWLKQVNGIGFRNCQNCCYSQMRADLLADASELAVNMVKVHLLAVASYFTRSCEFFWFKLLLSVWILFLDVWMHAHDSCI